MSYRSVQRIRTALGAGAVVFCLVAAALLEAQSFTASVRGVVTDASQAAIPGAKVTITDVQRNLDYTTQTDAMGRYVVMALPPGRYTFAAEAAGFQKFVRGTFDLSVQQQATMDVQMTVGQLATAVEVEATAPLLNSTSATLGQVIENRYIVNLPLIGRNPYSLAYLTPGIVGSGGRAGDSNTNFVAVGTRNSTADVMLDGVSVTGPEQNSGITMIMHTPSVEAVQEFKVQTSYFSAEFGNTGGAIINMITKSGTNQFHGSGYWFFRDYRLNANNWFSNRANSRRPISRRQVYGGTLGGPVIKDKTFFFFSYEKTAASSPVTRIATFPSMQQRRGDFSDYRTASGQQINIFNPFSLVTVGANTTRAPFPNNVIPLSLFDPVAVKAASYYPEPNQPGNAFTQVNNWFGATTDREDNTQLEIKGDHNFTDKTRVSMRYSPRWQPLKQGNVFGEGRPGLPWSAKRGDIGSQKGMFDFTRVHSANTIFNVRFGMIFHYYFSKALEDFDLTTLGLPKYMADNASSPVMPQFQPGDYTAIGETGWVVQSQEQGGPHAIGNVTKIIGGHNLKVGGEFKHNFLNFSLPGYPTGSFSFSRQITSQDRFAGSSIQGNGFASMLLGWGSGSRYDHTPWSMSRNRFWAGYVQDDWKLTRKLTVNLGLRYELDGAAWEKEHRLSYWDLAAPSPINGKVPGVGPLMGAFAFTDENRRSAYPTDTNNWQPRLGIAYALNDKTTIRSGYGMFYTLSRGSARGSIGTGFSSQSTMEWSRDSNLTRYATLGNPYPDGMNLPPGRSLGPMTFLGMGATTVYPENIKPSYHSWNFSIQRQLPAASVLEINYTGTKGQDMFLPDTSMSRLDPQFWGLGRNALTAMVPNPFYGVITDPRSSLSLPTVQYNRLLRPFTQYTSAGRDTGPAGGNSNYNALQMKYEKRLSRGLSMLAHYTIAKMIDDTGDGLSNYDFLGGAAPFQDFFNRKNERALSAHDVPQRFVATFAYELPVGKGRALGGDWGRFTNMLLGGWTINGFLTFQSGVPIVISQSGGVLWEGAQRPNLVGDPSVPGSAWERMNGYFNSTAFVRPASDVMGSAPRLLNYRAPGFSNADMSLLKSFAVNEQMRGEFRLEMQNATNSPNFGAPSAAFGSTSFGVISGYGSGLGPRVVQLGAKFQF